MIPSLWLPVAGFLTELLAHATRLIVSKSIEQTFQHRILSPKPLLELRAHLSALKVATDDLAKETHSGTLAASYAGLRAKWLEIFAPAQTVLHNLDPMALSTLGIYSPALAALLTHGLLVSEQTLSDALKAEQLEIEYDSEAHLCTLCLQIVRNWSNSGTIAGGLTELSGALAETLVQLDCFVKSKWDPKDTF